MRIQAFLKLRGILVKEVWASAGTFGALLVDGPNGEELGVIRFERGELLGRYREIARRWAGA